MRKARGNPAVTRSSESSAPKQYRSARSLVWVPDGGPQAPGTGSTWVTESLRGPGPSRGPAARILPGPEAIGMSGTSRPAFMAAEDDEDPLVGRLTLFCHKLRTKEM